MATFGGTPDWVKDAVFYQIFPDRFAYSQRMFRSPGLEPWHTPPTPHGFKGGDLYGVAENLDYLVSLGVNALYFNPIFQSTANHRYHTHDFFHIDPVLGGDDAFDYLLHEAHARGVRIVLDGVFNHASRGIYQFNSILENQNHSPFKDWFIIHSFPVSAYNGKPNYDCWWGLGALPKFNTECPMVQEFLWDVGVHWIEKGIDGWRLDVPEEIKTEGFWEEFRRRVRRANPEAYLVGEVWSDAHAWVGGNRFDGCMNYQLLRVCISFFLCRSSQPEGGEDNGRIDRSLVQADGYGEVNYMTGAQFSEEVQRICQRYTFDAVLGQLNLLSSHDTARFRSVARGNGRTCRLAYLFLFLVPGAPCIFYGDEIGMEGGRDPMCRGTFPWQQEEVWDCDMLASMSQAAWLRRDHTALRRGRLYALRTTSDEDVTAFARRDNEELIVVILNRGSSTCVDIELPAVCIGGRGMVTFRELWWSDSYNEPVIVTQGDGLLHNLNLPALDARILRLVS